MHFSVTAAGSGRSLHISVTVAEPEPMASSEPKLEPRANHCPSNTMEFPVHTAAPEPMPELTALHLVTSTIKPAQSLCHFVSVPGYMSVHAQFSEVVPDPVPACQLIIRCHSIIQGGLRTLIPLYAPSGTSFHVVAVHTP